MPITLENRRFAVFEVSNKKIGDFDYFNTLYNAIENEEAVEEFFYYLMKRKLPQKWRAPEHLPKTKAEINMLLLNHQHSELKWLIEKAKEGE